MFLSPPKYIDALWAITRGDLNSVRTILQNPESSTILDENGNNLLQMSIISEKPAIFDHLLSSDRFDLDASNSNGETALLQTLHKFRQNSEYFALELLKKGANIHSVRFFNNTILHFALFRRYAKLAEIAIEKGADVNALNDAGCAPIHMLLHVKSDPEGINNCLGLMLAFGVDAFLVDYNGYTPFELAVLLGPEVAAAQENLFYYTFDSFVCYELNVEVFFALIDAGPTWFDQIVDKMTVTFSSNVKFYPLLLFCVDPNILQTTIKYFDNVVVKLLESEQAVFACPYKLKYSVMENFEILFQSHLALQTTDFIRRIRISSLIRKSVEDKVPEKVVCELVLCLLSRGVGLREYDLEVVYKTFGFCELFKTLLYMDVKKNKKRRIDIIPKIFFDVDIDVKEIIGHYYTQDALHELLCYFSHSNLKNLCYWSSKELAEKVSTLPNVPSLLELSRDVCRKFLFKTFNLSRASEFFSLVKKLPITRTHEEILTYETKLY